jgi:hypothetical protein
MIAVSNIIVGGILWLIPLSGWRLSTIAIVVALLVTKFIVPEKRR